MKKKILLLTFALIISCSKNDVSDLQGYIDDGEIVNMTSSLVIDGSATSKKAGNTRLQIIIDLENGEQINYEYELEAAGYEFCYFHEWMSFGEAYMGLWYNSRYKNNPDRMQLNVDGVTLESVGGNFVKDSGEFTYEGPLEVVSVYNPEEEEIDDDPELPAVGERFNSNIQLFDTSHLTESLLDEYRRSIKDIITGSPYYIWSIDGENQVDQTTSNRTIVEFGYEELYGGTLVVTENYGCNPYYDENALYTEEELEQVCAEEQVQNQVYWEVNRDVLVEFEGETYSIFIGNPDGSACTEFEDVDPNTGEPILGNFINNSTLFMIDSSGRETILFMEGFGPIY